MKQVVNAIILDKNRVLVIKRKSGLHKGKWAFPGGIIEKGETEEQALKREVKEETNLNIIRIVKGISSYDYKRKNKEKTIGKSFLVEVKDKNIKTNNEVEDYRWLTIEEMENLDIIAGIDEEALEALY